MNKGRLEAFSDGVFAILITIMVLEIRIPEGTEIRDLKPIIPILASYVLSFVFLAIYWNNHHHLLHTVHHVTGDMLWANIHLLFWLSLVPFVTGWMGENNFARVPLACYGIILLMAALAYYILVRRILKHHGPDSVLARAVGKDVKGKISPVLYFLAIISCTFSSWVPGSIYVFVALIWLIPDKRIEVMIRNREGME